MNHWDNTALGLLEPLEDTVKDFARNELHRPYLPRRNQFLQAYREPLNDFGWTVEWVYTVLVDGVPNSRPNMEDPDGVRTEIELISAAIIGADSKAIDVPLASFGKHLHEAREIIEGKIDDGVL